MKFLLSAFLVVDAVKCAQATNNVEDATRPRNHLHSKADTHSLFRGEARAAVAETNRAGIINGHVAQPGEYPYAVSTQSTKVMDHHFCGGSLIARDVVLSAAHCQKAYDGSEKVVLGRHDLGTQDGQAIEVAKYQPHPDYTPLVDNVLNDNDFMLIYLQNPAVISANVSIITPNSDPNEPAVSSTVNVVGWGDTNNDKDVQEFPDVLMEVDLDVMSNEDCSSAYAPLSITPNMLCAQDFANKQGSCQGDSGGPLVEGNRLVGVVSYGVKGCVDDFHPLVYARVSQAYEWIREQVCEHASHVPDWADCPAQEPTYLPTYRPTFLPEENNYEGACLDGCDECDGPGPLDCGVCTNGADPIDDDGDGYGSCAQQGEESDYEGACVDGCDECDGPGPLDCGVCTNGADPIDDDGDGYGSCDDDMTPKEAIEGLVSIKQPMLRTVG